MLFISGNNSFLGYNIHFLVAHRFMGDYVMWPIVSKGLLELKSEIFSPLFAAYGCRWKWQWPVSLLTRILFGTLPCQPLHRVPWPRNLPLLRQQVQLLASNSQTNVLCPKPWNLKSWQSAQSGQPLCSVLSPGPQKEAQCWAILFAPSTIRAQCSTTPTTTCCCCWATFF